MKKLKTIGFSDVLLESFAEMNPDEALSYTLGLSSDRDKYNMSGIVVRNWARQDVQAALAAVSNVQPASLASHLEDVVLTFTWAEVKPRELIENIASIAEESRLRSLESAFRNISLVRIPWKR